MSERKTKPKPKKADAIPREVSEAALKKGKSFKFVPRPAPKRSRCPRACGGHIVWVGTASKFTFKCSKCNWTCPDKKAKSGKKSKMQELVKFPAPTYDAHEAIKLPPSFTRIGFARDGIFCSKQQGKSRLVRLIGLDGKTISEELYTPKFPKKITPYPEVLARLLRQGDAHFMAWAAKDPKAKAVAAEIGVKLPKVKAAKKKVKKGA